MKLVIPLQKKKWFKAMDDCVERTRGRKDLSLVHKAIKTKIMYNRWVFTVKRKKKKIMKSSINNHY